MPKRSRHLVHEYLEDIPRKALKDYHSLIKKYIKRRSGVYALYTGDQLKYVGLAVDLKNRLITHFHDRHARNWDKFSIYLTSDHKHLRDLEALAMRIANPSENRNRTKFKGAENLWSDFKKDIVRCTRGPIASFLLRLLGEDIPEKPNLRIGRKTNATKVSVLEPYMVKRKGPLRILASYKGKKYSAMVSKNGCIRYKGRKYFSPSAVAEGITKGHTDGWHFWKYKDPQTGNLAPLDTLRRG